MRARIALNLRRTREKLTAKKQTNLDEIRVKTEKFRISLEKKYDALERKKKNTDIEGINETVTRLIYEAASEVVGKALKQGVSKLSETTRLNKEARTRESD